MRDLVAYQVAGQIAHEWKPELAVEYDHGYEADVEACEAAKPTASGGAGVMLDIITSLMGAGPGVDLRNLGRIDDRNHAIVMRGLQRLG